MRQDISLEKQLDEPDGTDQPSRRKALAAGSLALGIAPE
jgi:hypothetical protein